MERFTRAGRLIRIRSTGLVAALTLFSLLSTSASASGVEMPRVASQDDNVWAAAVDKAFNLHQMTPTLYRSALPNSEKLPLLLELQVQTVVNFTKEDDAAWLGNSSVKQVSIPLHAKKVVDADVLHVLRTLQGAEANGPVLMHCKHGRNRTGLMAAMYRTVVQGWSKEDAINEMQQGGYGSLEEVAAATRYVKNADVTKLRLAFTNGDCSTTRFSTCYLRNWFTRF